LYESRYSIKLTKKLKKLKKKNLKHYLFVRQKMNEILENPYHKYKELRYSMKNINRIHLGHFVLVFTIDHIKKTISFEDYAHHDKIYKK